MKEEIQNASNSMLLLELCSPIRQYDGGGAHVGRSGW
jgi:hypothetical protein